MEKLCKKTCFKIYINFIKSEIPNFIQIMGIISLISFSIKKIYISIIIAFSVSYLFDKYFFYKITEFLNLQFRDSLSLLNREKISEDTCWEIWEKLIIRTSIISLIIASIFSISFYFLN